MTKKTEISLFNFVQDNVPKKTNLDKWLKSTIKPTSELKEKVLEYRKTGNKKIKESMPCVTISATFKKVRELKRIKKKNPFIVIDIDRNCKAKNKPSNTCIDMQMVKDLLSKHPSTYYCGRSIGNDGIYCIIKTDGKSSLIKYFKYFKKAFKKHGINIDESCKDYTRLRFFSYDDTAYYNPKAQPFKIPKQKKITAKKFNGSVSKNDLEKVETVVSLIEKHQIDITSDYNDWIVIAGALYSSFGEQGRSFFLRVSRFYQGYNEKKANRKFDNCMNMRKVTLSSFFHIATSYGIRY